MFFNVKAIQKHEKKKKKKKKTAADMRHFLLTQTKLSGLCYSNKSLLDYFLMKRKSSKS